MEFVSECRVSFGCALRYYRWAGTDHLYWERWEWRTAEARERRSLVVGWTTPIGLLVGLVSLLLAHRPPANSEATWVHVASGWGAPYAEVQS